jgi:hypothetical protein
MSSSEQTTKENATMNARRTTTTAGRSLARRAALAGALLVLAAACLVPAAQATAATAAPAWGITATSQPTNLAPGSKFGLTGSIIYVRAVDVGGAPVTEPFTITDTLSEGLRPQFGLGRDDHGNSVSCAASGQTLTCTDEVDEAPLQPGEQAQITILLAAIPADASGTETNQATVSGGGAAAASTTTEVAITPAVAPFDFLPGAAGVNAWLRDAGGSPDTEAGSHPYTLTVGTGTSSARQGTLLEAVEHPHNLHVELPPGVVVNPNATPVRCTEAQLESDINGEGCPPSSQVGTLAIKTVIGQPTTGPAAMYNMVPPPGHAAEFGFDVAGVGVYVHFMAGVRYDSGYRLVADADDINAKLAILGTEAVFWNDPSDPSHDDQRDFCALNPNRGAACPVKASEAIKTPVLTMPTSCSGALPISATVNSWENPGVYKSGGSTTPGVTGCASLDFTPSLEARPTTNVGDSPTGLSVDVHVPQNSGFSSAAANLKKAVVVLPEGLTVNPSAANGLEGCSAAQIGFDNATGEPDNAQPTCPDASKIGDVEVDTPLLPNTLKGSVYLAKPYDNPFGSLLAIYAVVDDPATGVLIKLAGHVEPDPKTGRLVTTFDNNPQLPFTDFKLHFFSGPAATLRTPSVCGTYSSTSQMTPWSAPESGPPATPSDSYSISANCSGSKDAAPNKPIFEAGTVSPIAGKYTPFVVHLRREDGSQEFSKLTVSPPPGLVAKLAQVPACPDAALAAAAGRSGRAEQADPSCPAASRIGTVHVGVGAGPAPYYTDGVAYLAGPYKGAPLSMAIITPAVAGPFDLGTVITRVALRVDPTTAQITADADPIPHILKGIPLDVRQIDVVLDKPGFSRTGTSCDPMAVNGRLASTLGQGIGLESHYQLGNCANLAFGPRLGIRLKGGTRRAKNPALIATLAAGEGEAAIRAASVLLPHAEFLDQGHIKTICTRVQFAAGPGNGAECPSGSIYGRAWARSPLLDYTLVGNVYLRSSDHKLPDLVVALQGPASQPIAIDLDGRVDSVKGAMRNTFEAAPDAPVSFFRLMLFGGKRGLVVNSRDICAHTYRAVVGFEGHNGATVLRRPKVKARCQAVKRRHRRGHQRRGPHAAR